MNQAPPSDRGNNRARKLAFLVLGVLVLAAALAWGTHWFLVSRNFETTDDAYVNGDVVQITSQVPGTVVAVDVDDTQGVRRGQLLAELDPADARIALNASEAQLARAVRDVRGRFAQRDALRAQIAQRQADLQRAQHDLDRRVGLLSDGAVSGEELSHARDALSVAHAALDAAREQLNATDAQIQGTTIADNPEVLNAEQGVRNAALALRRTQLRAPVGGVIDKRSVQVGQRVAPGAPLMVVVPLTRVWVDANFKEAQLRDMRVGQPVTLHSDLYGGSVAFHGKLAGMAAGSGSAFALLPAQNASGNWIKIVQRVPVRIALDANDLQAHPLRVGLSMTVRVDVQDTSGALVSDQVNTMPLPTLSSDGDDPQLEAKILSIIAQNAGAAHRVDVARAP
ncbi:MAG: HlyD family efflux transporter periplasmic adaptor subunit [Steroidobacteraceae bacterium]